MLHHRTQVIAKTILIALSLLLALVLATASFGQTVLPISKVIFRGNPDQIDLTLSVADTSLPVSAALKFEANGRTLPNNLQPTVTRSLSNRQLVTVFFTADQTQGLNDINWLEVRVGGVVKAAGRVSVTRRTVASTPQGSISIGGEILTGNQSKVVHVSAVSSGHVFAHGLGTRLIIGDAFWDDTGRSDALWKVEAFDDNTARLIGPVGEVFTGNVAVTGFASN